MEGCAVVYHCAATTHGSWADYLAGTVQGTRNVLEAARAARVKRFVYLSSLGVYPVTQFAPNDVVTEDAGLEPHPERRGRYTQSKVEAEKVILSFREQWDLPIVILRPGTIYGPRGKVFFPRIGYALRNQVFVVLGRGRNILPLAYIDNVIDALCLAGSRERAPGHIYNVVDDELLTQREYLDELTRAARLSAVTLRVPWTLVSLLALALEAGATVTKRGPIFARYRLIASTRGLRYDTSRAKEHLGWKPNVPLLEGLKRTFDWYLHERLSLTQ